MKLLKISAAAAGLLVTTVLFAAPAQADDCDGMVCMWEDPGFSGSRYVRHSPGSGEVKKEIGGWNGDNEISSVRNDTGRWLILYDNDGWTGTKICMAPRTESSDLAVTNSYDNEAESFKIVDHNLCG